MNHDVPSAAGSSLLTHGMNSPATVLSGLFSKIEYTNRLMLVNLAKCHNVQLPSQYSIDILRTLICSHLSGGDCAHSIADGCMQLVTSFHVDSDVPFVLTKHNFQIRISSFKLYYY